MAKHYTLTECYELLDVDPKTFRKWLDKVGLKDKVMKEQKSKSDERVKYLTQEQLEMLAAKHERTLPEEKPKTASAVTPEAYKLLADQLVELRQLYEGLGERMQSRFSELEQLHKQEIGTLYTTYANKIAELEKMQPLQEQKYEAVRKLITDQGSKLNTFQTDLTKEITQKFAAVDQQVQARKVIVTELQQEVEQLRQGLEKLRQQQNSKTSEGPGNEVQEQPVRTTQTTGTRRRQAVKTNGAAQANSETDKTDR